MTHDYQAPLQDGSSLTSRELARFFGKTHGQVLIDIRRLMGQAPAEFSSKNFVERVRVIEGANGKTAPYYLLAPAGFALVTLGYVGKKTLAQKIAIASAGNWSAADLAEILAGRAGAAVPPGQTQEVTS